MSTAPNEERPPLSDFCSRTFLFLTSFREHARDRQVSVTEVETLLRNVWRQEKKKSEAWPKLYELYGKAHYLLAVCADEVIRTSDWEHADDWRSQEVEYYGTSIGGERFFDLLQDPSYRDPDKELAEVFYLCLAIGFQGMYAGNPASLQDIRKGLCFELEGVPRDRSDRVTPEVYEHTKGEDFTTMPVASTVRLMIVLVGVVLTLGLLAKAAYSSNVEGLRAAARKIADVDGLNN